MDVFGLSALDRLFCFMIVQELQNFSRYLQRSLMRTSSFVKVLQNFVVETGDGSDLIRRWREANTLVMWMWVWLACDMIGYFGL